MTNYLSFDLEEWFVPLVPDPVQWQSLPRRADREVETVLRLLDRSRTRATFFVLGATLAPRLDIVQVLLGAGHEVATHGTSHQLIYGQTGSEFRKDVRDALELLHAAGAVNVLGYRAPCFSITSRSWWALPILEGLGLGYDSSIFPVYNPRYGVPAATRFPHRIPGTRLVEFPPATGRILGVNAGIGGVYFRFLPFSFIRRTVSDLNRRGQPATLYLHPWELDPGQPRLPGSSFLHFRHYHRLDRTAARLAALLDEFAFAPIRTGLDAFA